MPPAPTALRLGGVPEHFNQPFHLALSSSRYLTSTPPVALSWTSFPGGTGAMCAAVASGSLDLAVVLTDGALAYIAAAKHEDLDPPGRPLKIVGTYVASPLVWGVHVAATSRIQHLAEINAKDSNDLPPAVVGVSRMGSGSHIMAHFDHHARGAAAVPPPMLVVGSLDGARAAFAAGDIDVFLWEKFTTEHLVASGELRRVGEVAAPWPAFVFVAPAESPHDDVTAAVDAVVAATKAEADAFAADVENAVAVVAREHRMEEARAREWLGGVAWRCEKAVTRREIERAVEMLVECGVLEKEVSVEDVCRSDCRIDD